MLVPVFLLLLLAIPVDVLEIVQANVVLLPLSVAQAASLRIPFDKRNLRDHPYFVGNFSLLETLPMKVHCQGTRVPCKTQPI